MVKLQFETIPEEVLLKVFKYLDKKSLKDASLVCKSWNKVTQEKAWYLHLKHLNHDVEEEEWSNDLLESKKKFVRIKITDCDELESNNLLQIFQKHGKMVKNLQIVDSSIDDAPIFIEILKTLVNVEQISLRNVSVMETYIDPEIVTNLPFEKLETLELINCDGHILKCFETMRPKTFKFTGSANSEKPELLLDFLANQKKLKTFALRGIKEESSLLFKSCVDDEDVPFRLKKLSLLNFKLQSVPNDYNHLLKFLILHAKTLHELEIGSLFPNFIFEFIFSKFSHLHHLTIAEEGIPGSIELFNSLKPNHSVTKLILRIKNRIPDKIFLSLLDHLPNLETFVTESCLCLDLLENDGKSYPNVLNLKLFGLFDSEKLLKIFPNAEKIHLNYLSWNGFTVFAGADSKVRELSFKEVMADNNVIQDFIGNASLEVLRFGRNVSLDEKFFEKIRKNCANLRILKILKPSLLVDLKKVSDIWSLKFYEDIETEFAENFGKFWDEKSNANTDPPDCDCETLQLNMRLGELNIDGGEDNFDDSDSSSDDENDGNNANGCFLG